MSVNSIEQIVFSQQEINCSFNYNFALMHQIDAASTSAVS